MGLSSRGNGNRAPGTPIRFLSLLSIIENAVADGVLMDGALVGEPDCLYSLL